MPDESPSISVTSAEFDGGKTYRLRARSLSGICRTDDSQWPHFMTGQSDAPVRVLLIDGDEGMRRVIAQELLSDARIRLQGQAASAREARRLLASEEFDVLMLDLRLADGSGFELIRDARRQHSHCEVIVVSALEDDSSVLQAFEVGATGYLLRNAWMQSFAHAVLQVVNGGAAITPRLSRRLLTRIRRSSASGLTPDTHPVDMLLTSREREVLRCVARGQSSRTVSQALGISMQTVNAHIKNIYKKLNVHSRAQAVSRATLTGQL